jgi:2'-5' RNA ligase
MDGLVTLLPEPYYQQVETIWDELEEAFQLSGIRVTPYPHFSWQIAESYDHRRLEQEVRQFASEVQQFTVRTSGIGIFSGPQPVIYIPVVKNQTLIEFHARLWALATPTAIGDSPSSYYHPDHWMPHISLAYTDVNVDNIAGVMTHLAFQSYNWEMEIDHLAFISEPTGTIGQLKFKYEFSGSPGTSVAAP